MFPLLLTCLFHCIKLSTFEGGSFYNLKKMENLEKQIHERCEAMRRNAKERVLELKEKMLEIKYDKIPSSIKEMKMSEFIDTFGTAFECLHDFDFKATKNIENQTVKKKISPEQQQRLSFVQQVKIKDIFITPIIINRPCLLPLLHQVETHDVENHSIQLMDHH